MATRTEIVGLRELLSAGAQSWRSCGGRVRGGASPGRAQHRLKELDDETTSGLDRANPSSSTAGTPLRPQPRAACRLETLGFEQVHDYVPEGRLGSRGLPTGGHGRGPARAGALARDDAVTCRLDDPVGPVREAIDASRTGSRSSSRRMGRCSVACAAAASTAAKPRRTAGAAMEPGPSTVRPDTPVVGAAREGSTSVASRPRS